MITKRELDELIARTPPGEPLFPSLDAMCEAFGYDEAMKERIRLDMEFTRPPEPGDTLN